VTVALVEPVHMPEVLARHAIREQMIRTGQTNIQQARRLQEALLEAHVVAGTELGAPMKLAVLRNEIAQGDFEASVDVPVELNDSEKTQHSNAWRTYRERNANLMKHRGQAFSLIQGQCTQLLQDKMKQDIDWNAVSISYDPLFFISLNREDGFGANGRSVSVCHCLRPRTVVLLFLPRNLVQPAVV
jgi:transposase